MVVAHLILKYTQKSLNHLVVLAYFGLTMHHFLGLLGIGRQLCDKCPKVNNIVAIV